jgi:hypothetical protein
MERETDRALVMPLPHPMDVARAGGTDEGGALCNYGVSFGQGEAKPPRDARSVCARVLPWCWCACVLLQLSRRSLAVAVCFLDRRRPSVAADPDIEVIVLFAQLLRQRIWAVPW